MSQVAKQEKQDSGASRAKELARAARHSLGNARDRAKSSFGNRGGAEFDPNGPVETRCRVGIYENIVISRPTPKRRKAGATDCVVRSLKVKGAGDSWDGAFEEARRNRDDRR